MHTQTHTYDTHICTHTPLAVCPRLAGVVLDVPPLHMGTEVEIPCALEADGRGVLRGVQNSSKVHCSGGVFDADTE